VNSGTDEFFDRRDEETRALRRLAVEDNLIHFGLESPDGECPDAGLDRQADDPEPPWWEDN
jgi:hypothetical protein